MKSKICVVFRYDDFTAKSPKNVEEKLFSEFSKFDLSITVGIVPFLTAGKYHDPNEQNTLKFSDTKIQFLKEFIKNGTVDPALHGFNHKSWTGTRPHSEFMGQSSIKQCLMINEGKKEIENLFETDIEIFIPPWNTYDKNTESFFHRLEMCALIEPIVAKNVNVSGIKTRCYASIAIS